MSRVVAAHGFQHRVAGNAEIAESVHDRPRISGLLGDRRLGMQRIAVAAKPIDQRGFRPGRRDRKPHRARATGSDAAPALPRRAAEAAVGAAECRLRDGCDQLAGRLVGHLALGEDQRALAGALVDHFDNALAADTVFCARERPVQRDALFAVDDP